MYFVKISIHALREESDSSRLIPGRRIRIFQSTLSVRRATTPVGEPQYGATFQSTLSVRRATLSPELANSPIIFQSTLSVRRATIR